MGNVNGFIVYILQQRLANLLFVLGFVICVSAYTTWRPLGAILNLTDEQSYQIFFAGIAAAFTCFSLAYFFAKYNSWRWFPLFVWTVCLSRVILEIVNPEKAQQHDLWEYFFFCVSAFVAVGYWLRYRYKKYVKIKNK